MMEYLENGRALELNPYIIQIDRFVTSLQKLMSVFLRLEEQTEEIPMEEMEKLIGDMKNRVCRQCTRQMHCQREAKVQNQLEMLFHTAESYGAELNIETKRKLEQECEQAPRFLRVALELYQEMKQKWMWNSKMAESRMGCAVQMDSFAQMVRHATRELDASIFSDEHLERKLKLKLAKRGIRLLNVVFFITKEGRYEVHATVKTGKGQYATTKEVCQIISSCVGKTMILERDERPILGEEYCTIICMEGPKYYTLQGIAKIGKHCHKISGDSFSMQELPGGKQSMVLSDGMGSGYAASKESAMVIDTLEELLASGFPVETALQMLNLALVTGREEVRFSTIDMGVFDLYNGVCELMKAGAASTFIKRGEEVEVVQSSTLPLGVVSNLEIAHIRCQLQPKDVVVLVTDGVMEALPCGEQEEILGRIVAGIPLTNPKEMAHCILEKVLEYSGEEPADDMTVLVAGIWSLEK